MGRQFIGSNGTRAGHIFRIFIAITLVLSLLLVPGAFAQPAEPDPSEPPRTERVEIVGKRTATSKTFRNLDGTLTTAMYTGAVHYRAAGRWEEIRSALVPSGQEGYAWRNDANAFGVHFKDALEEDFLRFDVDGRSFYLSADPTGVSEGVKESRGLTFTDAFAAVDLRYDLLSEGVKETLVLPDRGSPTKYDFTLRSEGGSPLEVEEMRDGSWEFYGDGGRLLFELAAPHASEAAAGNTADVDSDVEAEPSSPTSPPEPTETPEGPPEGDPSPSAEPSASPAIEETNEGGDIPDSEAGTSDEVSPTSAASAPMIEETPAVGSNAVSPGKLVPTPERKGNAKLAVKGGGREFELELSIDPSWLRAPERQFPVLLDPTITIQPASEDASYAANCANCYPTTDDFVYIGADNSDVWRAALKFDLGDVPLGADVTDARLKLYFDQWCTLDDPDIDQPDLCSGTTHQLDAHKMTGAWSTSTKTSGLSFAPTATSSFTLPQGPEEQWMDWDLTGLVSDWLDGAQANHGVLVKRNSETLGSNVVTGVGRRYTPEPSLRPKLEVTYTSDGVHLLQPDTLHADGADLDWERFTGPSGASFDRYEVHRSASAGFTPSADTLLSVIRDPNVTSFRDTTASPDKSFTYEVLANGHAGNERTVTLPPTGQAIKFLQPGPDHGQATTLWNHVGSNYCGNLGAVEWMWVGTRSSEKFRSALKFDLTDVPADSTIQDAELSLWNLEPPNFNTTVDLHRITRPWKEGTGSYACTGDGATWHEADGGINWGSPGGDIDPSADASVSKTATDIPAWDDFDVTSLVQEWSAGSAPNHGVMLKFADETLVADHDIVYYPDDHTVTPTLRPKLAVTYSETSPAHGPSVFLSEPGAGADVGGNAVRLAASASDDGRVDKVEFLVDGTMVGTDTSSPYEFDWNSTSVSNGSHVVTAKAYDDAGNTNTTNGATVTVDNTAGPSVSVTSPTGGTVSGAVSVAATASDDSGIAKVEFFADGMKFAEDPSSPYTASWNTLDANLPAYDGPHVLTAKAHATSGQTQVSAERTVTVANRGSRYRVGFTSSAIPQSMAYDPDAVTQQKYGVDVTIANQTTGTTFNKSSVFLRYRWIHPDPATPTPTMTDSANISLGTTNLAPGSSRTIQVLVDPPSLPEGVNRSLYKLRFDLYETSPTPAKWFASKGNQPLESDVIVTKPASIGLGLERYYHYVGEELGAGMTHLANVADGNSLVRWTPFSSPGRGLSTVLDLTYNSLEKKTESHVGNNFSLAISSLSRFGNPLDIHPNKADEIAGNPKRSVTFTDGDGTEHEFVGKQHADGTIYWE
ncbi:MAG: DNRLRE domain-containing protein, partial [Actinomycetota bacterium]